VKEKENCKEGCEKMSEIVEFELEKGVTKEDGKSWRKKTLKLTVKLPTGAVEDFHVAYARAERIIDEKLGEPTLPQIPQVDMEEIMKHKWKGRKIGEGKYAEGSLSWGWDFSKAFSEAILQTLERGPLQIDDYEISLNENKNLVQTKKRKD